MIKNYSKKQEVSDLGQLDLKKAIEHITNPATSTVCRSCKSSFRRSVLKRILQESGYKKDSESSGNIEIWKRTVEEAPKSKGPTIIMSNNTIFIKGEDPVVSDYGMSARSGNSTISICSISEGFKGNIIQNNNKVVTVNTKDVTKSRTQTFGNDQISEAPKFVDEMKFLQILDRLKENPDSLKFSKQGDFYLRKYLLEQYDYKAIEKEASVWVKSELKKTNVSLDTQLFIDNIHESHQGSGKCQHPGLLKGISQIYGSNSQQYAHYGDQQIDLFSGGCNIDGDWYFVTEKVVLSSDYQKTYNAYVSVHCNLFIGNVDLDESNPAGMLTACCEKKLIFKFEGKWYNIDGQKGRKDPNFPPKLLPYFCFK